MDEGSKEPSIPQSWLERNQQQQKRLNNLTPEQKKTWGITESSLRAQQEKDEKENPSK